MKDSSGVNTNVVMEYKSTDNGKTWRQTQISPPGELCNRTHGETYNPSFEWIITKPGCIFS